jgi:FMN hydrolase / 5-amino-6-(5-phospho-D-ribitylamino)uracil phosphatase
MARDLSRVTTIVFDADGTLWDFDAAMHRALALTGEQMERLVPGSGGQVTVPALVAWRDAAARDHAGEGWSHEAIRLESFRRALAALGRPDDRLALDLAAFYLERRFSEMRLYDDVLPALTALRRRYTFVLLTNGNSYPERCGLAGVFAFTVLGQECGLSKPDRRIYELALARAGCTAAQVVSVGDSLENDVAGPQRCGIAGVWLNRQARPLPDGYAPDHVIASLGELSALLP